LVGSPTQEQVLWYLVAGNGFGFAVQGIFFWWWKRRISAPVSQTPAGLDESLAWRRTSVMGFAWLCYLAFNNIDVLMLGLMSNAEQVGLYGAAYRVLNQVLASYYLLTQVLYPQLARRELDQRRQMLRARILLPLAGCGVFIAAMISLGRGSILMVVFGHQFLAAAPLLLLLAWSIPLDFMTSYLSNAFLAWEMERKVLACTGVAAIINIGLNLALIPKLGAWGAAINTLVSYVVLLAALYWVGSTSKEIGLSVNRKAGTSAQVLPRTVVSPEIVSL
jgi:O-antigen/teichoic acid export membrane protein